MIRVFINEQFPVKVRVLKEGSTLIKVGVLPSYCPLKINEINIIQDDDVPEYDGEYDIRVYGNEVTIPIGGYKAKDNIRITPSEGAKAGVIDTVLIIEGVTPIEMI